jgi:hypothetical protein
MVLFLLENGYPLDEVIFYDTGMEFDAIYRNRDKLRPILEAHGVKYTELYPSPSFLYQMLERPVKGKTNPDHKGYGWCGGSCRWGTTAKNKTISQYLSVYAEKGYEEYIGIAYDEPNRLKEKLYPLYENRMKEADCLRFCRERMWNWLEDGVDLYDILDRVSCWCCANKNRKELFNIYLYLPRYWEKLKALQAQIDRPMKKFTNKKYGDYGNLFELEKVFAEERSDWLDRLLEGSD